MYIAAAMAAMRNRIVVPAPFFLGGRDDGEAETKKKVSFS
jgi:hypothetical protein